MRIHLVTPRNPPSFWAYDEILAGLRGPGAFKEAVSFAISHRAFHGYVAALTSRLDAAIAELESDVALREQRVARGGS